MIKHCHCCNTAHKDLSKLRFKGYMFVTKERKQAYGALYDCGCDSTLLIPTDFGKAQLKLIKE